MNKILASSILAVCVGYAAMPQWSWEKDELSLKKEQLYKAHIGVGEVQKDFQFRWTLYKNNGLVLHIRYDKFNHQALLYKDYQRNAFKIPLGKSNGGQKDEPQLVMYFKDFSDKKAHFKLYIEGNGAMVLDESISEDTLNNTQNSQNTTTQGQGQ